MYQSVLGPQFQSLPPMLQQAHGAIFERRFQGIVRVDRGINPLARLLADMMGLPKAGINQKMLLIMRRDVDGEVWIRQIGKTQFQTRQCWDGQILTEQFGPLKAEMTVPTHEAGLQFHIHILKLFGLSLPAMLMPKVSSLESAKGKDHYSINVDVIAPYIGRLVHYKGDLAPV